VWKNVVFENPQMTRTLGNSAFTSAGGTARELPAAARRL
jgi:hypothetical protein